MASRRVSLAISWLLAGGLGGATGCYPPDEGQSIPLDKIYFPVGIAVSPGRSWLYVANSDFDLQFSTGTLQVYDLDAIRSRIPKYCRTDDDCAADGQVCDNTGQGSGVDGSDGAPTYRCVDPARRNPCERVGGGSHVQSVAEQSLTPGLCSPIDPGPLLVGGGTKNSVVSIGAFATDVIYATNPLKDGEGARLFVPVRGDATVHWIETDDDTNYPDGTDHRTGVLLDCGQSGPTHLCDQNHRRGIEPHAINPRANASDLVLPPEPYGVALQARPYGGMPNAKGSEFVTQSTPAPDGGLAFANEVREALVTTHQTTGQLALFINRWSTTPSAEDGPVLTSIASGLPSGALSIAALPLPAFWIENPDRVGYLPSFLTTFTDASEVALVRAYDDTGAGLPRPFIDASRSVAIQTNASGFESRGIAIDSSARLACEDPETGQCVAPAGAQDFDRATCLLEKCEKIPLAVYVANRSPASLIVGVTPVPKVLNLADDLPRFNDSVAMSAGPSRVVVGSVIDTKGRRVRRVFIVCFDSRRIYVYDPAAQRFETEIVTGRGPHPFALDVDDVDNSYAYGYVGHFSDSYIGVVDLDQRHTATYGKIVLSIGQRTPPRASK